MLKIDFKNYRDKMAETEKPAMSRCNLNLNMMKSKKSFKELAKQMSALQEDQLGKLKGGFSSFSLDTQEARAQCH